MKHTPGPWTLMDDTTFSTLGDKRIIGANRISPAIVFGGLGAETDANARLIAASPELLATLKDLYRILLDGMQGDYDTMLDSLGRARKIIEAVENRS